MPSRLQIALLAWGPVVAAGAAVAMLAAPRPVELASGLVPLVEPVAARAADSAAASAGSATSAESGAALPTERCAPEPPLALASPSLAGLSPREIAKRVRAEKHIGPASFGSPTRGALWNGLLLASSDTIEAVGNAWGTEVTVRSIERAAREVARCFPGTPKLFVGDISQKAGGHLLPHRSHQSGLDADIGYYYTQGPAWFVQITPDNLDRARTWALVRALLEGDNVEYLFMDQRVQDMLRAHAASQGETIDAFFSTADDPARPIRHLSGHNSHFHVRFRDLVALETARAVAPFLPHLRPLLERPPPKRRHR